MRHAGLEDLKPIESLLMEIRKVKELKERTPGHFYYKGKNIIHFHVDNGDIYADIGDLRLKVDYTQDSEFSNNILANMLDYMQKISMNNL
jgi:hypothetical protein